jgi:methylated-DNA-protein-cysteine methyltransferase related protein
MKRPPTSKPPIAAAVAAVIRQIPRGRVATYGAVAEAAGYPRCARHVSKVLSQVRGLPWHRVLGCGGHISLRGEYGLEQRFLLEAEGVRFKARRVDMVICEHHFPGARRKASSGRL